LAELARRARIVLGGGPRRASGRGGCAARRRVAAFMLEAWPVEEGKLFHSLRGRFIPSAAGSGQERGQSGGGGHAAGWGAACGGARRRPRNWRPRFGFQGGALVCPVAFRAAACGVRRGATVGSHAERARNGSRPPRSSLEFATPSIQQRTGRRGARPWRGHLGAQLTPPLCALQTAVATRRSRPARAGARLLGHRATAGDWAFGRAADARRGVCAALPLPACPTLNE
jgi:hypothetical protein